MIWSRILTKPRWPKWVVVVNLVMGPLSGHNAWQSHHPGEKGRSNTKAPESRPNARYLWLLSCPPGGIDGRFQPRDDFFDHYSLTIPDDTDTFYPDGQIHEEDYEFTPFLGSRMHSAGVRCH